MNKIRHPWFIFSLAAMIIVSCSDNRHTDCEKTQHPDIAYNVVDSITIQLPEGFRENFYTIPLMQYWSTDSAEGFYILSDKEKVFYKYDLKIGKMEPYADIHMIPEQVTDFIIYKEKIFLTTINSEKLYAVRKNKSGQTEAEIILNSSKKEYIKTNPFIGDRINIITDGNEDYLIANIYTNQNGGFSPEMPVFARFNIRSGAIENRIFNYSEKSKKFNFLLTNYPAKIDIDSISYVLEGHEHYIYKYNNRSGKVTDKFCNRSKFISEDIIEGIPYETETQDRTDYTITAPYYLSLIRDKSKNKFYRLVKHSQPLLNSSGKLNKRYGGPWSLLTMDKDFNIEGETLFSGEDYLLYCIFPVREGILLARNESNKNDGRLWFHLIRPKNE